MAPQKRMRGDSGTYGVSWHVGGRRAGGEFQSNTFPNEKDADKAMNIIRRERDRITVTELLQEMYGSKAAAVLAAAEPRNVESSAPTVRTLLPQYIASMHDAGQDHKIKTASRFELEVFPVIGDRPVDLVEASDIDQIIVNLQTCDCSGSIRGPRCKRSRADRKKELRDGHTGGVSRTTVERFYTAMKGFFTYAEMRGHLRKSNPVKAVNFRPVSMLKAGAARKIDRHYYMEGEEFEILLQKFSPQDQRLVETLVQTGMRVNEALALQRKHISLRDGTWYIDVHQTWVEEKNQVTGETREVLDEPKGGSFRTLAVLPELISDTLKVNLERCHDEEDWIFVEEASGERIKYDIFENRWQKATLAAVRCANHYPADRGARVDADQLKGKRCGDNGGLNELGKPCGSWVHTGWDRCTSHIGPDPDTESSCACASERIRKRPKIHDLRHTHVAWLIADKENNIHLTEIARRLGHTSTAVTEHVYSGLLRSSEVKVLSALATKRIKRYTPDELTTIAA